MSTISSAYLHWMKESGEMLVFTEMHTYLPEESVGAEQCLGIEMLIENSRETGRQTLGLPLLQVYGSRPKSD